MIWPFQANDEQAMWRLRHEDDAGAFAELMGRWQAPVRRLCARMVGDVHRAEDLSQETFARVFAHRHTFELGGRFSTWMWRIAVNLCRDELRRRGRRPESPLAAIDPDGEAGSDAELVGDGPNPAESAVRLEEAEWVRRALAGLPEHYRSVVILRHYEGLRFAEIAEVLGIPTGTAKSRMAEGLDRLGELLRRDPRADGNGF